MAAPRHDNWRVAGSVLDSYSPIRPDQATAPRSIVVSLGTSAKFGFRRLVERLVSIVPEGTDVFRQVGSTDVTGLPIEAHDGVPSRELEAWMAAGDMLIAPAGAVICLTALRLGKVPLLVPRRPEFDEHVDDHQLQLARLMAERGLAVSASGRARLGSGRGRSGPPSRTVDQRPENRPGRHRLAPGITRQSVVAAIVARNVPATISAPVGFK